MDTLSVDTCFLIDFQRERLRGEKGRAHRFLAGRAQARLAVSMVAWGEYVAGFEDPGSSHLADLRRRLVRLEIDDEVAAAYARVFRQLKAAGRLIGANDLWIAATALACGLPLVSRNESEFGRIGGLTLLEY